MDAKKPILDDVARLATGAMGAVQAAGEEAKELMRAQMDRAAADMDIARMDDLAAVKAIALSALERVEALERRIDQIEGSFKSKG